MFIGIVGPEGAGRRLVANLLVEHEDFQTGTVGSRASSMSSSVDMSTSPSPLSTASVPLEGTSMTADKASSGLIFPSAEALMDHVTRHWKERFVLAPVTRLEDLEVYRRRPCFLLLYVDAPMLARYRRLQGSLRDPGSLEEFVEVSDASLFPHQGGFLPYAARVADLHLVNGQEHQPDDLIPELHELLQRGSSLLRPSWDTYFSSLAFLTAKRSNCMKRRVGAILVRDRHILAAGYNGTPRGLPNCLDGGCPRCNAGEARCGEGLETCLCLHAEENALLEAGRERIVGGEWCTMYCSTCPCLGCAKKIVQSGVKEVVYSRAYGMDDLTARLFSLAGVQLRQYDPSVLPPEPEGKEGRDVV
ncbi:MAG: cytidine deaminase-like protein [Piptocephalis tieghemiana]|nr:MAG: cytidine deaminase-like protein [Piptocephalis tieghemiana]